jgi:RNA polymerase sigma-70 factor (ECF subfamily)
VNPCTGRRRTSGQWRSTGGRIRAKICRAEYRETRSTRGHRELTDLPAADSPLSPTNAHLGRDGQSDVWLRELRANGRRRDEAVARLHALLLRGARYTIARHRTLLPQFWEADLEQIALESADDATVAVLSRLDDFRGESRFTTWAYKFAFLDATAKLRQRAWRGREIPTEPESWTLLGGRAEADQTAEVAELLGAIGAGIAQALTDRQRDVLVAVAVNGVAIEVVADRLGTTRGALYKTLHEARNRLRAYLAERGLRPLGDA